VILEPQIRIFTYVYCNEQVLLASVLVLITLIPACLLCVGQHTESAHA